MYYRFDISTWNFEPTHGICPFSWNFYISAVWNSVLALHLFSNLNPGLQSFLTKLPIFFNHTSAMRKTPLQQKKYSHQYD